MLPAPLRTPLAKVGETFMAAAGLLAVIDAAFRVGEAHPNDWPLYVAAGVGSVGCVLTFFGITLHPAATRDEPLAPPAPSSAPTSTTAHPATQVRATREVPLLYCGPTSCQSPLGSYPSWLSPSGSA